MLYSVHIPGDLLFFFFFEGKQRGGGSGEGTGKRRELSRWFRFIVREKNE